MGYMGIKPGRAGTENALSGFLCCWHIMEW